MATNQLTGDITDDSLQISGTLSSLGLRGFSAYELAVKNHGYTGTEEEWLRNLKARFETNFDGEFVYYKFADEDEWYTLLDVRTLLSDSIYLKKLIDDKTSGKVDKKEGYSLLSDTEIARLKTLKNYEDSALVQSISSLESSLRNLSSTHTSDVSGINTRISEVLSSISSVSASLSNYALRSELPTKVSQLDNDKGYLTSHQDISGKVDKVQGKQLSTNDYTNAEKQKLANIEDGANNYVLPSDVVQDSNYTHTDNNYSSADKAKVDAIPDNPKYTDTVYNDEAIRLLITNLSNKLNGIADSDDTTLDQLSEIVAYIKSNKSLIEGITTSKISYVDIIDNLVTNVTNKPLSASQGVVLKGMIDSIESKVSSVESKIPTRMSELEQDVETGKIDSISLNGVEQEIDENKNVNLEFVEHGLEYNEENDSMKVSVTKDYDDAQIKKEIADTKSELFESIINMGETVNGKLDKPEDPPIVGKVLKVKEVNEDGTFVCEWADEEGGQSTDVQINGTSITQDGVANIPPASNSRLGVMSIYTNSNFRLNSGGQIYFDGGKTTQEHIKSGTGTNYAVPVMSQHIASFYGLAKASGDTTMATSTNPVGTYTEEAKTAIQQMLGILSVEEVTF